MVKLIVGVKGTGKTKTLIDMVHNALNESNGSVVCIEKGSRLGVRGVVKREVRMINTADYSISNADALYGMVCGLHANNFDITHIFIDSALKICSENMDDFSRLIELVNLFSEKNNVSLVITASLTPEALPTGLNKYLITE